MKPKCHTVHQLCCGFDSRRRNSDGTIIRVYLYPSIPSVKHSLHTRVQEVYYITNYDILLFLNKHSE